MPPSNRQAVAMHIEEIARRLSSQSTLLQTRMQHIQGQLQKHQEQMDECRRDLVNSQERYQQMQGFLVEIFEEIADMAEVEPATLTCPTAFAKALSLFDGEEQDRYEEYRQEMKDICEDMQHEQDLQVKIETILAEIEQDKRTMEADQARYRRALHQINNKQRMVLLAAMHSGLVKFFPKKMV